MRRLAKCSAVIPHLSKIESANAIPLWTEVRFWRSRWESNPRHKSMCYGFQDRSIRPLWHCSMLSNISMSMCILMAEVVRIELTVRDSKSLALTAWLHPNMWWVMQDLNLRFSLLRKPYRSSLSSNYGFALRFPCFIQLANHPDCRLSGCQRHSFLTTCKRSGMSVGLSVRIELTTYRLRGGCSTPEL